VFVEPLAAAFEILDQVPDGRRRARRSSSATASSGCSSGRCCPAREQDVRLVGHHAAKLERARASGSAPDTPAPGADLVVDATGAPDGARGGARARPSARHDRPEDDGRRGAPVDLAPAVINEVTIVGSRCGRFSPALAALADGRVSVAPLIDAVYPLDEAVAAFAHAARPGTLKVLVDARS
jgi:threonine dehydrogenase-like Zn-dependent dehydrogenase